MQEDWVIDVFQLKCIINYTAINLQPILQKYIITFNKSVDGIDFLMIFSAFITRLHFCTQIGISMPSHQGKHARQL